VQHRQAARAEAEGWEAAAESENPAFGAGEALETLETLETLE